MKQLVVGLTGGIGTGKTTVAQAMGRRGATIIDVDLLGRPVLEPGGGAYASVVAAFGDEVLDAQGGIDRKSLADRVFGVNSRLDELESISHPAINAELSRQLDQAAESLVVLDMAVLAESRLGWVDDVRVYQRVIVVEAVMPTRIPRLERRGLTFQQIGARIGAQASTRERRLLADLVVQNDGTHEDLEEFLDLIWPTLEAWQTQQTGR